MAMVAVLGSASATRAQITAQFDLNQFRPTELATDGFAVSHADGQGHLRFGVQIYLDFARNPLELRVTGGPIPDQTFALVRSQLTGHLLWSLGLWDRLVIFMDLPYHFILRSDLTDAQRGFLDSIGQGQLIPRGRGLGDLYVGARGVLYGTREHVFQLAAQATLTANTASAARSDQNYLGEPDKSPNIGGWFELLGTFNGGNYVRIPLNLGYKTGFARDVPSLGIGGQLTFGAGVQVLLGQDRFMLTVESFGRTTAQPGTAFGGRQETPVELLGGFKYLHQKGFTVGVAGTGGVTSGYGNPDWRLIGMLAYTMPEKEKPVVTDSIFDIDDARPDEPEPIESPRPPEKPVVIIEEAELEILDKIYFDFDSAKLQKRSYLVLDDVAGVLNAHPDIAPVRVEGHTDSRGRADYNLKLSQRRAESVVRYLIDRGGVDGVRLIAKGFGETQPLVLDATTEEDMAKNRRVEFHFGDDEPDSSRD